MAVKADKELTLGILFTARTDDTLKNLDKKLTSSLRKAQGALNKYATGLRNVDKASAQLSRTNNQFNKQIGLMAKGWDRLRRAAQVTAAYGIAATAIYSITNALKAGVAEIVAYDQALKNLQAITQATDVEIGGMGETMRQLARTTKFSTTEVAEGMVLLGQAGFSAAEVMDSINAATTLATGTLSNMATTTDLLTSTVRAFMLDASESGRVVDVMASAINRSKLTIDKLRIAFNFVGAAAAQTGLSLEDTAATMMILANNGLRASTIGTGMRQVLSRLLAPSAKLRDAFERHGIALDKVNPRLVGYKDAIKNLAPLLWDNKKQVVDMAKAYELFGLRGAQAAAVIVKSFVSGEWDDMLKKVYDVGAATRMATKQQEGLAVKWKNLIDRVRELTIAFGDAGVTEALRGLITMMAKSVDTIRIFVTNWGRLIGEVGIAVGVFLGASKALRLLGIALSALHIMPVVAGFIALVKVEGVLTATTISLTRAMNFLNAAILRNPIGVAALAIAALVVWYRRGASAAKAHAEAVRRQGIEHEKAVNKIRNVREQLAILEEKYGENVKESHEYHAILERLIQDQPEFAQYLDNTAESYDKVTAALKKYQATQEIQEWKNWAEQIRNLQKSITEESVGMTGALKSAANVMLPWFFDIEQRGEQITKAFKDKKEIVDKMIQSMVQSVRTGVQTEEDIVKFIREALEEDSGVAELLIRQLNYALQIKEKIHTLDSASPAETEKAKTQRLKLERAYMRAMATMTEDETKKAHLEHKIRLADAEKWLNARLALVKKGSEAEKRIRQQHADWEYSSQSRLNYDLIKIDKEASLEHAKWKYKQKQAEIAAEYSVEAINEKQRLELEQKKTEADRKYHAVRVDILDIYIDRLLKHYDEESDIIKRAQMEKDNLVAESQIKLLKSEIKGNKERLKQYESHLIRWLRETDKKSQEWLYILQEARDADLISQKEYEDAMIAATGSWIDNIKHGLERAEESMKSWGEVWQEIGGSIQEQFASGLTSGIWDYIAGVKTAKEAFSDFARSMLKWLFEMIVKQQILNMLQMAGGGPVMGGAVGGVGSPGGAYVNTPVGASPFHTGGIVGKSPVPVRMVNSSAFLNAPRLHNGGLAGDEVPTILKKGEGVFTPEQMEAMGGQRVEIVNLTDARLMESYLASPRGRNAILNVIGQNSRTIRRIVR